MLHVAACCFVVAFAPQESRESPPPVDVCASVVVAAAREAGAVVARAAAQGPPAGTAFAAVYVGTVATEAHLARPGELATTPVRLALERDADGAFLLRETRGVGARARTTSLRCDDDGVRRREGDGNPWETVDLEEGRRLAAAAARFFPATLLAAADRARPTLRPGPALEHAGARLLPVTFGDAAAGACTLLFDAAFRLVRAETLSAHPVFGDVCEWARFDDYEAIAGVLVPRRIARFAAPRDVTIEHRLELVSFRSGPPSDDARDADDGAASRPAAPPTIELVPLEPGIFSAESAVADARALVVERERDLVLLEAPGGDDVTTSLLRALAERFPGKPVALVACGHHHPSPSGGLRAVAAAGAEIVVPEALAAHYERQLRRPTTLGPPAVAGPAAPRFRVFRDEARIEAGDRSVVLLDIGMRSDHTERYVVFYFPETGLLFEGDLGWFPAAGPPRATSRLRGLAAALAERGIRPRSVVQSWPVRGARRRIDWSTIEAALAPASRRTSPETPVPASRPLGR